MLSAGEVALEKMTIKGKAISRVKHVSSLVFIVWFIAIQSIDETHGVLNFT
jgi:hypothetical protein